MTTTTTSTTTYEMPSTMQGPPICALVPPGKCQVGPEPVALPLLQRWPVSPTSSVLRFGLPNPTLPLNLSVTACLVAIATMPAADEDQEEEEIERKYSPISTNADIGYVDLLVKDYGPPGKMSRLMHQLIPGQDKLFFKHTTKNVKIQAPFFPCTHLLMIAGGTGIAPMIQALHAILGTTIPPNSSSNHPEPKVVLLYGSQNAQDILGQELLRQWANDYPQQFTYLDILSQEPADSDWTGLRGFINEELIQQHFPYYNHDDTTTNRVQAWVCGPKPMYQAICGPKKNRSEITGVLGNLGFTADQVIKM